MLVALVALASSHAACEGQGSLSITTLTSRGTASVLINTSTQQ